MCSELIFSIAISTTSLRCFLICLRKNIRTIKMIFASCCKSTLADKVCCGFSKEGEHWTTQLTHKHRVSQISGYGRKIGTKSLCRIQRHILWEQNFWKITPKRFDVIVEPKKVIHYRTKLKSKHKLATMEVSQCFINRLVISNLV